MFGERLRLRVEGRGAPSGVPNQPFGDEETLLGARNRVAALCRFDQEPRSASNYQPHPQLPSSDLVVSIEGGVGPAHLHRPGSMECFAWVCAVDPHTGAESTARSSSFVLPRALAELVEGGLELGEADNRLFSRQSSGRGSGTIGRLSNGVLDRTEFHVDAVVCCLVPFLQPDLYGPEYGRFLGRGEDELGADGSAN